MKTSTTRQEIDRDTRIAAAAKLLSEADISFLKLVGVGAHAVGLQINESAIGRASGLDDACGCVRVAIREAMAGARIPIDEALVETILWTLHQPALTLTQALREILDKQDEQVRHVFAKDGRDAA